jgi:hypothetical protein
VNQALEDGIAAAFDERIADARRLLLSVWNSPIATDDQKGQAAYGMATTFTADADREVAIQWAQRARDRGYVRADALLRQLRALP